MYPSTTLASKRLTEIYSELWISEKMETSDEISSKGVRVEPYHRIPIEYMLKNHTEQYSQAQDDKN